MQLIMHGPQVQMTSNASGDQYTTPTLDYSYNLDPESYLCDSEEVFGFVSINISVLYCLVFFLSLIGNSLVLCVLIRYENLESITNTFIFNLCLSDLVFSCLLPFWTTAHHLGWIFGDVLCKILNLLFSLSLYSSIIFLTVMTIHRYLSVVNPLSTLRTHTLRYRLLVSLAIWVTSLAAAIPDAIFHKVMTGSEKAVNPEFCDYFEPKWLLVSVCQHNVFFLFSMVIILFCYIEILRTLVRSRSRRRHRTVRLIFAIVMAYFLSWGPYNVLVFLETLVRFHIIPSCSLYKQLEYALHISREIAFSHCCFNPVLYVFVGIKFRRHLKSLCYRFGPCRHSPPGGSSRSTSQAVFPYEEASFY
ncbi:chemokine XC receptor 1 isoform X1 [Ornithorhynchus anatinus]|nr:chemokine XC receptor 1 isoform X1 [Ornithorhynchus anatinus]XP_028926495.1 chemokine XC receptor 1 isoform X1 [Ornithorhynchus anatinus]